MKGFGVSTTPLGLGPGQTAKYAFAWMTGDAFDHVTGLSGVTEVAFDVETVSLSGYTGVWPEMGAALSVSGKGTALFRGGLPSAKQLLFRSNEKTSATAWAAGDTVAWTGGSGTIAAGGGEADLTNNVYVYFDCGGAAVPYGVTRAALYRLEDATGYWRHVHEMATDLIGNDWLTDNKYFPYSNPQRTALLPSWPGPLDEQSLPETLLSSLAAAQAVASHKGCLFAAEESKIRFSEPEQPRYFRDWTVLDAMGMVLAMVSRDEVLEVYTPTAVKYIVGNAPYFEIRETGITEGPVARDSIVRTDIGTFALFDDGICLVTGSARRNLTSGVNTPWLEAMADRESAVAGSSHGVYYLVDDGGNCLAYDWEADEWFGRSFPAKPLGFLYCDGARALVAKLGSGSLIGLGASPGAVAWAAAYPEIGGGRLAAGPDEVTVDCDGDMLLEYRVDDTVAAVFALSGPEIVPLPVERGRTWRVRLSGVGSAADTAVRAVEWRG